jgi:hypothetical protein
MLEAETYHGRRDERQDFDIGSATTMLRNNDRRFSPKNTSSPYNPNIKKTKQFKVECLWLGVTYTLHRGFVEEWPTDDPGTLELNSPITSVDAFQVLSLIDFTPFEYGVEKSHVRMTNMLGDAGWPIALTNTPSGLTDIQAVEYTRDEAGNVTATPTYNGLEVVRAIAKAERGQVYIDGMGVVQFRDRLYRLVNQGTNQATFGDGAGELPCIMAPNTDPDMIINTATAKITKPGAESFTVQDGQSFGDHFARTWSEDSIAEYDPEAEGLAQFMVDRFADPPERIDSITISGMMDSNIWPLQLGLGIGSKITVNRRFFGKGVTFTQISRIESIKHTIKPESFITEWGLSPVSPFELASYWQVGAGGSQLGTNTALAF